MARITIDTIYCDTSDNVIGHDETVMEGKLPPYADCKSIGDAVIYLHVNCPQCGQVSCPSKWRENDGCVCGFKQ